MPRWARKLLNTPPFLTKIRLLVNICIKQDVNLVSREYYKEELAFQQQIDRIQQTDVKINPRPLSGYVPSDYLLEFSRMANPDLASFNLNETFIFKI